MARLHRPAASCCCCLSQTDAIHHHHSQAPPHLLTPPPHLPCSRDYILSCCDEAARRREALWGAPPRATLMGRPRLTDHSWERMFFDHLHWKRWTQERMGPYHSPI